MIKKKKKVSKELDGEELWKNRLKWIMPIFTITLAILIWELLVRYYEVPHYLIPAPTKIFSTLLSDCPSLIKAMFFTVKLTFFFTDISYYRWSFFGVYICSITYYRD